MNDKIQHLEKKLETAKKEEEAERSQRTRDGMTLVGKCYSTHLLSRYLTKKPAFQFEVIHYISSAYHTNSKECLYEVEQVAFHKDGNSEFTATSTFENENYIWVKSLNKTNNR